MEEEAGVSVETLLQQVYAAHGGEKRWKQVGALSIVVRCGGAALAARFQSGVYRHYRATVDTHRPMVRFKPFKGHIGAFTPERVWIASERGEILAERSAPRDTFPSWRRHVAWDRLDVLYFGGYAMWNYLCTPFLWRWRGLELSEGDSWHEAGETWRTLKVHFPKGWPTHSAEQIFYIDSRGRIRRHDYTADVIGPYARAVHYCDRHRMFDGLLFPTRRRVYPRRRNNRALPFPTLIWIDIDHVAVEGT
jgi:hypothetical protein